MAAPVKKVDRHTAVLGFAALTLSATSWLSPPAEAVQIQQGFAGPYAPANWTLQTGSGNGSVNTSSAPASISITGSNDGSVSPIDTDYTITALANGPVSFEWQFSTSDDPGFDIFGYILNGTFFNLANQTSSGTFQFDVAAGTSFGFRVFSSDDAGAAGTATIQRFSAPVPGPLPVLGAAAAFGWSRRLRRRTSVAATSVRSDPA